MPITPTNIPDDRTFAYQMDPSDVLNAVVDWSNYLANGVTISTATATLSTAATAAGVELGTETNDDTTSTHQLTVASGSQSDASFDPPGGLEISFKVLATLSNGETRERSFALTVVQQ
jgi:hypothetical protein